MERKSIIAFGDSNTYGYDPRSYFGARYSEDCLWCSVLEKLSGRKVINAGQIGRNIPDNIWELRAMDRIIREHPEAGLIIIMLGSNDVLLVPGTPAELVAERMERLLRHIKTDFPELSILLLSPPPAFMSQHNFDKIIAGLPPLYEKLAEKLGVPCYDTGKWNIALAYDGVHFSESGHVAFAKKVAEIIKNGDA